MNESVGRNLQYLCQFTNAHQNNWSDLLPIAEFAHNSWPYEYTRHMPHKLIHGFNPMASFQILKDSIPTMQEHLQELAKSRSETQNVL